MPDQVMQSLFGARDAARSRGDKMTAAFERMMAVQQEREQLAKQEAAQRLQFMEQTANQKSWWRDTDEPTRTAFFDQMDREYETLGMPAAPRSDRRVEFLSADIDRIMKDANQGIGVVEDPKTGTVRLSPLVIAKLRDDYGDWADRQFVDMGNTLMAQTPQPPVTEAPGVDTSKAKTVQGKESLVMDAGAALPQTQHIGRLEDSLNEMLGHVMNSPERREKIAHDADLSIDHILDYVSKRQGNVGTDDPWVLESVKSVNNMRAKLGLTPLDAQWFIDSGNALATQSLSAQANVLKTFMPDNSTLRPELLGALAPDLMGKLPQTGGQTVPQEAVGEMTSAGVATGQPAQGQPQSPYVAIEQGPDPKRLGEYNSIIIRYLKAKEQNANDPMLGSLMQAAAAAYEAATGEALTQDKWDADNMTAEAAAKIGVSKQNADTNTARAKETVRHNKAMEENARISANASMKRADTAIKNWQANRDQATGNKVVEEYGRLSNERVNLLKAGFTTDSAEVKRLDAKIKALEPAYNNALRFTNGGGGGGGIDTSSTIDEGYLRRLARKYPSMTSDTLIKQYVGGRDKHYGWDYDQTYAVLHDERVKMGKK